MFNLGLSLQTQAALQPRTDVPAGTNDLTDNSGNILELVPGTTLEDAE